MPIDDADDPSLLDEATGALGSMGGDAEAGARWLAEQTADGAGALGDSAARGAGWTADRGRDALDGLRDLAADALDWLEDRGVQVGQALGDDAAPAAPAVPGADLAFGAGAAVDDTAPAEPPFGGGDLDELSVALHDLAPGPLSAVEGVEPPVDVDGLLAPDAPILAVDHDLTDEVTDDLALDHDDLDVDVDPT